MMRKKSFLYSFLMKVIKYCTSMAIMIFHMIQNKNKIFTNFMKKEDQCLLEIEIFLRKLH